MTQFLIEEACLLAYDAQQAAAIDDDSSEQLPGPKPGEITDPRMMEASAQAKRIHRETYGVSV